MSKWGVGFTGKLGRAFDILEPADLPHLPTTVEMSGSVCPEFHSHCTGPLMTFRTTLLPCLALSLAFLGCDTRPTKPMTTIPKSPAPVDDDGLKINREEVEAANRRPLPPSEVAPELAAEPGRTEEEKPVEPVRDPAGGSPWLDADAQLPLEYWEAQYFNAQRIGMTHYTIEDTGKKTLTIRMETHMQFARGERPLRQSIVIETREKLDGQLESFSETLTSGALVSQTVGTTNANEMKIKTEASERSHNKQIDWPVGTWGPMGIHQMLLRNPMQPGEARTASVLLPQRHQLAQVTLVAGKPENTTCPDGLLADVLPIDLLMQLADSGIRVRMWCDALGRVQKTIWPEGHNLSSFRISREAAMRLQAEDEIESYASSGLIVESAFRDIQQAKQVLYLVTSDQPDPHDLFSRQSNQAVRPRPVYETDVAVFAVDWKNSPHPSVKQLAPSLNELNSSALLPSDHPQIERLAKQWSDQASSPVAIAQALLAGTFQHLRKLEFTPTIHPVQLVAQGLEGDCVEHAMLLVALLRNRQVPARIASGLRLQERDGQAKFGYHMWTEAWLDNRWVPMDATTGQLTNCTYLKFIDTSLTDTDPYQPVLTVLRSLKHLKVSSQ